MKHETNQRPAFWFPSKRDGWGWGLPVVWQGWLVLLVYAGVIAGALGLIPPHRHPVAFFVVVAAATLALLAVCWFKGERPHWRWGGN